MEGPDLTSGEAHAAQLVRSNPYYSGQGFDHSGNKLCDLTADGNLDALATVVHTEQAVHNKVLCTWLTLQLNSTLLGLGKQ